MPSKPGVEAPKEMKSVRNDRIEGTWLHSDGQAKSLKPKTPCNAAKDLCFLCPQNNRRKHPTEMAWELARQLAGEKSKPANKTLSQAKLETAMSGQAMCAPKSF